ncbi:hypothetical protein [Vibrio crassostreae]|uniref:hypothetical protein n=1 Tax=Vibrio crassostreae TaxID=246167 RepID=UPI00104D6F6A|nr:hypothetical protein [Vibrio crassostreae]TCT66770.1 hypothetical protein EDB31_117106 [Vibrio crassostreae]
MIIKDIAFVFLHCATAWAVPGAIMASVVSLGSFKHIIFIDRQLAKNLSKYYDDNGYMRTRYQLPWEIGRRCFHYWVKYPFIRKRVTTDSVKFKVFMWVNALGIWSYIFAFGLMIIGKYLT